jgi:uncharacterized protein YdhG (YjbR/CyaY superfamily)
MPAKFRSIDEYLETLNEQQRAALHQLRQVIKAAAPKAEEGISYQIPTFRLHGPLVAMAAWKKHYALYPMSSTLLSSHPEWFSDYPTSKGTVQFAFDEPLPNALVRKVVKARIAENLALAKKSK